MKNIPTAFAVAFTASVAFVSASPTVHAYNFLHETEFAEAVQQEERVVRNRIRTDDFADRTRNLEQEFAERQQLSAVSSLGRDTSSDSAAGGWEVDTSRFNRTSHLSASVVSGDMGFSDYSYVSGDMDYMSDAYVSGDLLAGDQYLGPIGDDMMIGHGGWQPTYLAHTGFETYMIALLALALLFLFKFVDLKKLSMSAQPMKN